MELVGNAFYMGFSFFLCCAKEVIKAPKDVQKSVAKVDEKIHKNFLEYVGDTHVYAIRKIEDGKVYKIGESAQGTRKFDEASKRAEFQVTSNFGKKLEKTTKLK